MKILTVIGARPQFIKAAAGSRHIRKRHQEVLVHTGQHFDRNMSAIFFEEMEIPKPDYNLGISGGSHGKMTAGMLVALEEIMEKEKPDAVLVYGDTNSTLSAALAAVKLHIPIFHVEAGNRTGSLENPEEVNRILTDHCSSLLFCASEDALNKLENENLGSKAHYVGNIMYDSFRHFVQKEWEKPHIVNFDDREICLPEHFYYMTCHRQENTYDDKPLTEILLAMNSLNEPTIYPVHPRNQERALRICKKEKFENILLTKPVGYIDSVHLTKRAQKIVTDSGGLQCEAFFAEKQCVFVFPKAVWPETMVGNRNQLAKAEHEDILEKLEKQQVIDKNYHPFGDGNAAGKICDIIDDWSNGNV